MNEIFEAFEWAAIAVFDLLLAELAARHFFHQYFERPKCRHHVAIACFEHRFDQQLKCRIFIKRNGLLCGFHCFGSGICRGPGSGTVTRRDTLNRAFDGTFEIVDVTDPSPDWRGGSYGQ